MGLASLPVISIIPLNSFAQLYVALTPVHFSPAGAGIATPGGQFHCGPGAARGLPGAYAEFLALAAGLFILLPFTWRVLLSDRQQVIRHRRCFAFQALTGIAGFHVCVCLALQQTAATNALLFFSISPLMIVFASRLVHGTPVSRMQPPAIAVSLGGVLVILTRGDWEHLRAFRFNRGDLRMLLAVTLWSAYSVMLKRKPQDLSPIVMLDGAVLCSVLMMAPFYVWAEPPGAAFHFTPPLGAALLYVSLFGVEFFM